MRLTSFLFAGGDGVLSGEFAPGDASSGRRGMCVLVASFTLFAFRFGARPFQKPRAVVVVFIFVDRPRVLSFSIPASTSSRKRRSRLGRRFRDAIGVSETRDVTPANYVCARTFSYRYIIHTGTRCVILYYSVKVFREKMYRKVEAIKESSGRTRILRVAEREPNQIDLCFG